MEQQNGSILLSCFKAKKGVVIPMADLGGAINKLYILAAHGFLNTSCHFRESENHYACMNGCGPVITAT